ncbi:MAG: hypothetical protein ACPIOQ_26660 [Promethearchaeia archaeon]
MQLCHPAQAHLPAAQGNVEDRNDHVKAKRKSDRGAEDWDGLQPQLFDFLKAAAAKRPDYFKDALPDGDVTGLSVREIKAAPRSRGVSDTQR